MNANYIRPEDYDVTYRAAVDARAARAGRWAAAVVLLFSAVVLALYGLGRLF